jgi:hypothetical protein
VSAANLTISSRASSHALTYGIAAMFAREGDCCDAFDCLGNSDSFWFMVNGSHGVKS